jgi:hypothetical protein
MNGLSKPSALIHYYMLDFKKGAKYEQVEVFRLHAS